MFLCSRLSQTLFNGFFWATRMQLSSFLSPTGLASCPPVFEHSLVQLECVSCNYLAFGIRQTRFKLFVLNYFALGLARIGLLVFGWVWTKWKGLPRSIWATHPVDSPSTTKNPKSVWVRWSGSDYRPAQIFNSNGVANNPLSQLSSLEFWLAEWVSMEQGTVSHWVTELGPRLRHICYCCCSS